MQTWREALHYWLLCGLSEAPKQRLILKNDWV